MLLKNKYINNLHSFAENHKYNFIIYRRMKQSVHNIESVAAVGAHKMLMRPVITVMPSFKPLSFSKMLPEVSPIAPPELYPKVSITTLKPHFPRTLLPAPRISASYSEKDDFVSAKDIFVQSSTFGLGSSSSFSSGSDSGSSSSFPIRSYVTRPDYFHYFVGKLEITAAGKSYLIGQNSDKSKALLEIYNGSKQMGTSHDFLFSSDTADPTGNIRIHAVLTKAGYHLAIDLKKKITYQTQTAVLMRGKLLDKTIGADQNLTTNIECALDYAFSSDANYCKITQDLAKTNEFHINGLTPVADAIPTDYSY